MMTYLGKACGKNYTKITFYISEKSSIEITHCMGDAPFLVIEKRQIVIEHAEIITTMEEIMRRVDGVAHKEARQRRAKTATVFNT